MAPSHPSGLVQPLSVGNVVSAGLRLYANRFKQYFGVALVATLWILLPFVLFIPGTILFVRLPEYSAFLGLLIPVWIGLLLLCSAKYSAGSSAIARLAFGELTNQPETTKQASRFTDSRKWGFLLIGFLLSLIYGAIAFVFYIALIILFIAIFAVSEGSAFLQGDPEAFSQAIDNNPASILVISLLVLAIVIIGAVLFIWLAARFAIAEVPFAIEPETGSTQSIGRGWELTSRNAWRVFLILFIAFLLTIPLQIIVQVLSSVLNTILVTFVPSNSPSYMLLTIAASYILSFASGVLIIPFWQSIKAVIYYDLRSRREGLGLELHDRF
ncbi:MAG: DUF975 domain-containing protein [Cyanobacteria bacterium CRU_2_1]|nr:DUF975 domain-containing protein [Cyanobacteria bacterium RU_5_0]NJR61485.1 DUF975 domain-containing protein [Cyanobacteria bacterium CRU_2_1]